MLLWLEIFKRLWKSFACYFFVSCRLFFSSSLFIFSLIEKKKKKKKSGDSNGEKIYFFNRINGKKKMKI
jgi:hypothetical protein